MDNSEALKRPYGEVFHILDEATRTAPADRVATALQRRRPRHL